MIDANELFILPYNIGMATPVGFRSWILRRKNGQKLHLPSDADLIALFQGVYPSGGLQLPDVDAYDAWLFVPGNVPEAILERYKETITRHLDTY